MYAARWWEVKDPLVDCTADELLTAIDGYIATDVLPLSSSQEITASGLVSAVKFLPLSASLSSQALAFFVSLRLFPRAFRAFKVLKLRARAKSFAFRFRLRESRRESELSLKISSKFKSAVV